MLTAFDLCTLHGAAPPAHHSQASAVSRPATTRVVNVRLAPFARVEKACTTATGPLVAILVSPAEESPATGPEPIRDAPDAISDPPWPQSLGGRQPAVPWAVPRPQPAGPVPEPSTWALLILGFGAVGARLRRLRQARSALIANHRSSQP
jgi:hypothetical protein